MDYSQIIELSKSIRLALKNGQDCPLCGSVASSTGKDEDGEIFAPTCECLLELDIEEFALTGDESCENSLKISNRFCMTPSQPLSFKKSYLNHCHNCGKKGINSEDPNCIEDPPYLFKCKFCGESLRTHSLFGEGGKFDCAQINKT